MSQIKTRSDGKKFNKNERNMNFYLLTIHSKLLS